MKDKRVFIAILAAVLILGMTACDDEGIEVFVTGVTLTPDKLSLVVGGSETLTATVEPSDATNKTVTWRSSDDSIVTVSGGVVNAVNNIANIGKIVTITVTTVDGNRHAYCTVTVSASGSVPVAGVTLPQTSGVIVGKTITLNATVTPSNASNRAVTWKSDTLAVATVLANESGLSATITGVAPGTAKITVTTVDGGKTAACTVTVSDVEVPVTSVTLTEKALSLDAGKTYTLVYSIEPSSATNQGVKFTSSNTDVATVDEKTGEVTTISGGNTIITITADDTTNGAKNDLCTVTVRVPVTGVSLNKTTAALSVSGTETLDADIVPTTATNKNVTWSSSNTAIATVSQTGLVTALSTGSATITVTTEDGNFTGTCAVTVRVPVTGVSLNKTSTTLSVERTEVLYATINPTTATNKTVSWSSEPSTVATVLANATNATNGLNATVTGVAAGTATITVTSSDGSFSATCNVTVSDKVVPVTGVSLDDSFGTTSRTLYVNGTESLKATITPNDATNQTVTWNSSDGNVATVAAGGLVTGIGAGTATITVTTNDGGFKATCGVTVNTAAVAGVTLIQKSLILNNNDLDGVSLIATIDPDYATNKNVTWKSSDITVATVSDNGLVTPVAAGRATITVTTVDNGKSDTCVVTVNVPVEEVTLATTTPVNLAVGASVTLTPTIKPPNASNKIVTWSSNNVAAATVSNGVVTGVAPGTATITVTTNDGGKTATCNVIVTIPVTGVSLNKSSTKILVGMTETLTATVAPANATNKTVTWSSGTSATATVSGGVVTGRRAGSTIITVTIGNHTDTCTVTVPTTYTVTFNGNGGYFSKPSELSVTTPVENNTPVSPPATKPTKGKDIFNGWYNGLSTPNGLELTTKYDFENKTVTGNITLYAKWIPEVEMVSIPSGTFNLGSPDTETQGQTNERPQRAVKMSAFSMGKFEVTQEQYEAVMESNPSDFDGSSGKEPADWEEQGKRPVEKVSWYEAIVFCNKLSMAEGLTAAYSISNETDPALWNSGNIPTSSETTWNAVQIVSGSKGYRLPTEAQWEYACRAMTTTAYNTGDTIGFNTGWYGGTGGNSEGKTHQVGLKLPNIWGLYDMHGNVFEWCWDWYNENAYNTPQQNADPPGPSSGTQKVRRGGSYFQAAANIRSAYRSSVAPPQSKNNQVGFRVVRPQ